MNPNNKLSPVNRISGLYAGKLRPLEPEGQQTGIFKQAIESAEVTLDGFVSDQQADRRYHGGPEKALHQYALSSYDKMVSEFPQLLQQAVPGSMGENISSPELADDNVCIGDIYRIGQIQVQVSQPRTPCWKINHRFSIDKLSLFVEQQRITGWYYRVLETGTVYRDDTIQLLDRPNAGITVAHFLGLRAQHRPEPDALDGLINCEGLNREWRDRLIARRDYLDKLRRA